MLKGDFQKEHTSITNIIFKYYVKLRHFFSESPEQPDKISLVDQGDLCGQHLLGLTILS